MAAAAAVFCSARHSRENNKIDDKLCLLTRVAPAVGGGRVTAAVVVTAVVSKGGGGGGGGVTMVGSRRFVSLIERVRYEIIINVINQVTRPINVLG